MTPAEKLKSILNHRYESEDGDHYKVELIEGMIESEIDEFKMTLPNEHLPS